MSFQFEKPTEKDRQESRSGLPAFRVLQYKAAKTPPHMAKAINAEQLASFFEQGTVGFSYWDKDVEASMKVQSGTFALLGMYWKLSTFTGGNKDTIRYTSNMVLDIKNDKMRVYVNGEQSNHVGTYRELKDKAIWGKETKVSLYWVVFDLESKQLCSIELTNTVKNGFKVSVLRAYGKPVNGQTIEREGLYGLCESDENFHVFTYEGVALASDKGTQYAAGEGDAYFQPRFSCGILRKEKNLEEAAACLAQKESFFSAIKATKTSEPAATVEPAGTFVPAVNLPDSWTSEPVENKDPFGDTVNDLPF